MRINYFTLFDRVYSYNGENVRIDAFYNQDGKTYFLCTTLRIFQDGACVPLVSNFHMSVNKVETMLKAATGRKHKILC